MSGHICRSKVPFMWEWAKRIARRSLIEDGTPIPRTVDVEELALVALLRTLGVEVTEDDECQTSDREEGDSADGAEGSDRPGRE